MLHVTKIFDTPRKCKAQLDSKGRTIRKVMEGGGWGIFEPQKFFFRYQIPCMNIFRP